MGKQILSQQNNCQSAHSVVWLCSPQLMKYERGSAPSLLRDGVDGNRVFYILDPQNDLHRTQVPSPQLVRQIHIESLGFLKAACKCQSNQLWNKADRCGGYGEPYVRRGFRKKKFQENFLCQKKTLIVID